MIDVETYTSSRIQAYPAYSVRTSPDGHTIGFRSIVAPKKRTLTIISSFFATLIPFLLVTCRYFNPLNTSCCTTKFAFMRNLAPSLMVKGVFLRSSRARGPVRSMVMSGRPSTSRASDLMTQRRWSLGSTGMGGEEEMPREAFQRLRDSSFWSGRGAVRRSLSTVRKMKEVDQDESGYCEEMGGACKRRGGECNCERIPISIPRRSFRHHSSIIGISSWA